MRLWFLCVVGLLMSGCAAKRVAPPPEPAAPERSAPAPREPLVFRPRAATPLRHDLAIPADTLMRDIAAQRKTWAATLPAQPTRSRVLETVSAEGGGYDAYELGEGRVYVKGRTSGESYDVDLEMWFVGGRPRYIKGIMRRDPTKFMDASDPDYARAKAARTTHTHELYLQGDQVRAERLDRKVVAVAPQGEGAWLVGHARELYALLTIPDALFDRPGYGSWSCIKTTSEGLCAELRAMPEAQP